VDESRSYWREALTIARELGDESEVANLLAMLARDAVEQGSTEEARRLFDEARSLMEAMDTSTRAGMVALANVGIVAAQLGDLEEAMHSYEKLLTIAHAQGNRADEATLLNNLADMHAHRGDVAAAGHI
jgi:tetratricopeptide (TPR) repeat protein